MINFVWIKSLYYWYNIVYTSNVLYVYLVFNFFERLIYVYIIEQ